MSCTAIRVDHLDWNETDVHEIADMLTDGVDTIYIFYAAQTAEPPPGNMFEVFLRKFTCSTETLSSAVRVSDAASDPDNYNPRLPVVARLDDGTLICAWTGSETGTPVPTTNLVKVSESTDDGATWSSPVTVSTQLNLTTSAMATDGTNVWLWFHGSGSPVNGQLWWSRRTGAGSWTAPVRIFQITGDPLAHISTNSWRTSYAGFFRQGFNSFLRSSAEGFILGGRYSGGGIVDEVKIFRSTSSGSTWAEVMVEDRTGDPSSNFGAEVIRGSDGNLRAMYVLENNSLHLATSGDFGATWAVIGTPSTTNEISWTDQRLGFTINSDLSLHVSQVISVMPGVTHYRVYRGDDTAENWERVEDCLLPSPYSTISGDQPGSSLVINNNYYHLGGYAHDANTDGTQERHLMLIFSELPPITSTGTGTGGEEPPPGQPPVVIDTYNTSRIWRRGAIQTERIVMPQPGSRSAATIESLDRIA